MQRNRVYYVNEIVNEPISYWQSSVNIKEVDRNSAKKSKKGEVTQQKNSKGTKALLKKRKDCPDFE